MITKKGSFNFKLKNQKVKTMKSLLPRWVGITAKNWFLKGFRTGGGQTDASAGGWEKRKSNNKGKGRSILVKSGALRNSIQVLRTRFEAIVVGSTGLVYARIHNFGLMGKAFGKHSFKMPKREYIGKSTELEKVIKTKIERELNLIFK